MSLAALFDASGQDGKVRFVSPTGDVWEVKGKASISGGALVLDGGQGNYARADASLATGITGSLDLRAKVNATDWTPVSDQYIISKWNEVANKRSYAFPILATSGHIGLAISTNGVAVSSVTSGAGTGFADATTGWIRVIFLYDAGTNEAGLVGYWPLNDGTGFDTVADYSNSNNTGTLVGTPTWLAGKVGNYALSLDGVGDYVNLGNIATLDFERTNTFSVECWVKTANGNGRPISKRTSAAGARGWSFNIADVASGGNIAFALCNVNPGNRIVVEGSTNICDDEWHHIAATYDGSSTAAGVTLYVDGVAETPTVIEDTLSLTIISTVEAMIGGSGGIGQENFLLPGIVDNVRVFNDVRTAQEIFDNKDIELKGSDSIAKFATSTDGITWSQLGSIQYFTGLKRIFVSDAELEIGSRDNGTLELFNGSIFRAEIRSLETVKVHSQKLYQGKRVELFKLDGTPIGGPIVYFTTHTDDGQEISFGGQNYTAIPAQAEGFEVSGASLATPKIRMSNVLNILTSTLQQNGDMQGAHLIRTVTYKQYLDDPYGETPDPSAKYPEEIYIVDRKSEHSKAVVEFELVSLLDQRGQLLPKRQILRDTCTHRYRRYDPAGPIDNPDLTGEQGPFDYSKATCPYVGTVADGSPYFKATGEATASANEDVCGKKLSDCKLRFGDTAELPLRSFPGVARIRR